MVSICRAYPCFCSVTLALKQALKEVLGRACSQAMNLFIELKSIAGFVMISLSLSYHYIPQFYCRSHPLDSFAIWMIPTRSLFFCNFFSFIPLLLSLAAYCM